MRNLCAGGQGFSYTLKWNALSKRLPLHHVHVAALLLSSCSYLALTSKADVARVESKTYICTAKESDAHPIPKPGVKALTANWRDPQDMRREIADNFNGCMEGEWGRVGEWGRAVQGGEGEEWAATPIGPYTTTFWCHRVTLG